ncbi:MAG: hypothetical protein A2Z18_08260, partial [Armatimonadetes bacterium RBG_16_58_9]
MAKTETLDVRAIPPFERHPRIFEEWERLEVGDTLEIINDHDPRPLHYQFMHEREGEFEWQSHEKGPQEWVAHIKRVAPPRGETCSA